MTGLIIVLILLASLIVGGVLIYNGLVQKRQMTENGWSDIDVQLKRRADLIPRLVETVKGYASHERELFREVTEARTNAQAAGPDVTARGAAESRLSAPTAKLIALKEDYPDLKTNENFLSLQKDLSDTEDKIEMARRFYNGAVREYNIKVKSVPSNLVAGPFGFHERDFFEIETADRAVPDVDFQG
ncbi:LemA family protein [Litorimonas sp. WD9-15]|uniref:LemA family protein n=1 Tax=Litorimonas sp. WD9-15 TaxID=3418716 RepID=UPI003D07CC23